jgi:hypothetical protein
MKCKKFNAKNGFCKEKKEKCPFANGTRSAEYVCKDFVCQGIEITTDEVGWANGKPTKYQSIAVVDGKIFAGEPRATKQTAIENLRVTARDWLNASKDLIAFMKKQDETKE